MTQLNKIEESLPKTLWSLDAPLDDTVDFNALRNCIDTIVAMGGITNEDQGTCLSNSGYSLESLKSQFNQFVDMNTFVIPANAVVSFNLLPIFPLLSLSLTCAFSCCLIFSITSYDDKKSSAVKQTC